MAALLSSALSKLLCNVAVAAVMSFTLFIKARFSCSGVYVSAREVCMCVCNYGAKRATVSSRRRNCSQITLTQLYDQCAHNAFLTCSSRIFSSSSCRARFSIA